MPKIVNHNLYRQELVQKCFDLFAEKGYSAVTMRQIAKYLDVSTGTLYHYFPSKEALFLQLVEQLTQQDIMTFFAETNNAQTMSERLDAMINFMDKYEDYFFKQTVLYFDFYLQQEGVTTLNNEVMLLCWEKTRQAVTNYLQIADQEVVDLILNFMNGLIC